MRGKERTTTRADTAFGITPAYAGKSRTKNTAYGTAQDHPRICGEKVRKSRCKALCAGITPAYAGKRQNGPSHPTARWDHPRICGEKDTAAFRVETLMGSPPHMRGKALERCCGRNAERITPAYAGKRLKRSRSTVPPVAIVPLFPSVCNKPVVSDGSPAGRDAPLFLPAENAVPASPAYNLRSL